MQQSRFPGEALSHQTGALAVLLAFWQLCWSSRSSRAPFSSQRALPAPLRNTAQRQACREQGN